MGLSRKPVCFIFSGERQDQSKESNAYRTASIAATLDEAGIPYKKVTGSYNGVEENSFVCTQFVAVAEDRLPLIHTIARAYNQECILMLDELRFAWSIPCDCGLTEAKTKAVRLGKWVGADASLVDRNKIPAWTWDKTEDILYYVRGTLDNRFHEAVAEPESNQAVA